MQFVVTTALYAMFPAFTEVHSPPSLFFFFLDSSSYQQQHQQGVLSQARSAFVSNVLQAYWAIELELPSYFGRTKLFSSNWQQSPKAYADVFEALLGALYRDQGLTACKHFVAKCIFPLKNEAALMATWLSEEKTGLERDETPRDVLVKVRGSEKRSK